jgi:hypothetical protein
MFVSHEEVRRDRLDTASSEEGSRSVRLLRIASRTSHFPPVSGPPGDGPRPGSPFMTPPPHLHDAGGPIGRSPAPLLASCAPCTTGLILKRGTCPGQSDTVGFSRELWSLTFALVPRPGRRCGALDHKGPIRQRTHGRAGQVVPSGCNVESEPTASPRVGCSIASPGCWEGARLAVCPPQARPELTPRDCSSPASGHRTAGG